MERIARAAAVLGVRLPRLSGRRVRYILTVVLAATMLPAGSAIAAGQLTAASVALSDPIPSDTSSYTFTGSSVDTATAILCVKVVWSTTASGDTAPAGFSGASGSVNAAGSSLIGSSATNWSLAKSDGTSSSGQNNIYKYTNSASGFTPASASGRTFALTGLTNPSTAGTAYFFQINTYANTDCVSSPIDNSTVQFINTAGQTLSLNINDTLTATVAGIGSGQGCDGTLTTGASTSTAMSFTGVTSSLNGVMCQDLQVATNAANGYSVYLRYNQPLTNALSQTIADAPGTNTSPAAFPSAGSEAYGYSTDDSTLGTGTADRFTNYDSAGHQGWAKATTTNAEIGYSPSGTSATDFHIGHQIAIATTTQPGTYTTTIIYTVTPVY